MYKYEETIHKLYDEGDSLDPENVFKITGVEVDCIFIPQENEFFRFSIQKPKGPISSRHKINQYQSRIIIYIFIVVLEFLMLHKF